jgi:methyl-accepting chemotaxis protein
MSQSSDKRTVVVEAIGRIRDITESTTHSIQQLAQMNIEVANAATEQSNVVAGVTGSIAKIATMASDIGESSTEATEEVSRMTELAQDVQQVSSKFKVS